MGNIGLPFGLTKDHISLEKYTFPYLRKDRSEWPSDREESPFEPLEGFPNGRKERGKGWESLLVLFSNCI